MNELMYFFGQPSGTLNFDPNLRLPSRAPSTVRRNGPIGEVKKPETINYRTFKPERDGLFCQQASLVRSRTTSALCGKYKRMKHRGVDLREVRRRGDPVQGAPRAHGPPSTLADPRCAHLVPEVAADSRIGNILEISLRDLERVLYFESVRGASTLRDDRSSRSRRAADRRDQLAEAFEKWGHGEDSFDRTGSAPKPCARCWLADRGLTTECKTAAASKSRDATIRRPSAKRSPNALKVLDAFRESARTSPNAHDPDEAVPVLPPDLRPAGAPRRRPFCDLATLNDLYRRVINRNNRLKRLHRAATHPRSSSATKSGCSKRRSMRSLTMAAAVA